MRYFTQYNNNRRRLYTLYAVVAKRIGFFVRRIRVSNNITDIKGRNTYVGTIVRFLR